ncbi:MAG: AI-2E family transporter [Cyclobacteriaceae bacterium]|nr:AI-2E family transporter [Cyclobacteriaceae bacterium]MCX7636772.1 AI-2E family transporter [Cyclobacteriaceae bacterium]
MPDLINATDNRVVRVAAWMIILSVTVFCLVYFSSFLQPIVIAGMIWYAVYELERSLSKIKIKQKSLPGWLVTSFAFLIILLVITGIYEIVVINLKLVIDRSDQYIANFRAMIDRLQTFEQFELIKERLIEFASRLNIQPVLSAILNSLTSLAGNLFIIIIYVAFLLVEEKFFDKKLKNWITRPEKLEKVNHIIEEIANAIRKYVVVKTQMSLLTGLLGYVILVLFKVDFAVWWAFLIFLLNYIPYIGSLFATLLPAVFASFQFQSFWMLLWVFLAIEVVQILVGNVLEPKIMGRSLNLSPLGVLIALTFWGIIWGILGMFLSVPITSVVVIVCSRFESTRFIAIWLSETGEIEPAIKA